MFRLMFSLCFALSMFTTPMARASVVIDYDIIPTALTAPCNSPQSCTPASAYKFYTVRPTWTLLSQAMAGANCWTCFTRSLSNNNGHTPFVRSAYVVVAHTGPGTNIRISSYWIDYSGTNPNRDESGRVWKRDWPALGNKPVSGGPCTVCLRVADWSIPMNRLFVDFPGQQHSFLVEVISETAGAVGIINMARMTLEYE